MSAEIESDAAGKREHTLVQVYILQAPIEVCYCTDWIKVQGVQFPRQQVNASVETPG